MKVFSKIIIPLLIYNYILLLIKKRREIKVVK